MKVLLTGSSGQLAKEFICFFKSNKIDFAAPDETSLDITDKEKIKSAFEKYKPSLVINCAAYNLVDDAQINPRKAFLINRDAVENLAIRCAETDAFFIHFGSDYVFDGTKNIPYVETDMPNPINNYGLSKFEGEQKAAKALNYLVFRLSWVIGQGKQNFLYKLKTWAKNAGELKISSDEVSVPTFTFDIVPVCMKAAENNLTGIFHLTNSGYASRYELACEYFKLKKLNTVLLPVPAATFKTPAKRPRFTAMSNALLSSKLGMQIPSWQESLEKYCEKYDD